MELSDTLALTLLSESSRNPAAVTFECIWSSFTLLHCVWGSQHDGGWPKRKQNGNLLKALSTSQRSCCDLRHDLSGKRSREGKTVRNYDIVTLIKQLKSIRYIFKHALKVPCCTIFRSLFFILDSLLLIQKKPQDQ